MSEANKAKPTLARPASVSRSAKIALSIVSLFAAVSGGFLLGHATAAGDDGSTAMQCAEVKQTLATLSKEKEAAITEPSQADQTQQTLTVMNIVLQNPDCFSTETRATAQTAKDQIETNANNAAVWGAADKIAGCAAGTSFNC